MEFWEALLLLGDYILPEDKYICIVCGHKVNYQWAIWRHIDNKHSDLLYVLSGQAHGWDTHRYDTRTDR